MNPQEVLTLIRHLARIQANVSQHLSLQRQEIAMLQKALMQARANHIIATSRLAWSTLPSSTELPSSPPAAAPAPPLWQAVRNAVPMAARQAKHEISLMAAEVVICQSGCLSHDAYWRVQEYCRRHGKRCLLLENDEVLTLLAVQNPQNT